MIDRSLCQFQLLRFSGLPGYPRTDQAVTEMLDAMQHSFSSEELLAGAVAEMLRVFRRCPAPADVYDAGDLGCQDGVPEAQKLRRMRAETITSVREYLKQPDNPKLAKWLRKRYPEAQEQEPPEAA